MQNIKRFQKVWVKWFYFTIFLLIKIIYQEVKDTREYILQNLQEKVLKNNILFPNYEKSQNKKTNIFMKESEEDFKL